MSQESDPRSEHPESPGPGRLVGLGIEFAVWVLFGFGIGYWIDHSIFPWLQPWGLIVGGGLGFAAAMTRIVQVSAALR